MVKLKGLRCLRFLFLFALLPCVLFGALAEFTRNTPENTPSSAISGGETPESGGTAFFISESLLLCGSLPAQNRVQLSRFWRQFLSFVVFGLLLKMFSKLTLRKYRLHNYFPQKFFHILVISLLGGRAPPRSA
jgi:UDP-N-acetylmuramyl pentapeptide phosphotransferase/UDP-N-acetylglucosamine-1-phosphate transferase